MLSGFGSDVPFTTFGVFEVLGDDVYPESQKALGSNGGWMGQGSSLNRLVDDSLPLMRVKTILKVNCRPPN